MFKLQKLNVVKVVGTEDERDKLIAKGFELQEELQEDKPVAGKK